VTHRLAVLVALVAALSALATPGLALGAGDLSLNDVEGDFMCVSCGVPLNIADSPQADRERALINMLIEQGRNRAQIRSEMVTQYGQTVLADPSGGGFAITSWLVPVIVVLGLLTALIVLLPRWRRRVAASAGTVAPAAGPALDPEEQRRLDDDLSRYR
jgi:cytochrome c-type biogenesis protein CcmH